MVDSLGHTMTSVVINPFFNWGSDRAPNTPLHQTVIYEAHVRGLTMRHPDVPSELRGTYLGLCSDPMLEYFQGLGVTALELLPVHQFVVDRHLAERGLTNYWGYNTIGYFAPHAAYSAAVRAGDRAGGQVNEFKAMVRAMHQAGLEVILDVVYNHVGPSGAYLDRFGPYFAGTTIWGPDVLHFIDAAFKLPLDRRLHLVFVLSRCRDAHAGDRRAKQRPHPQGLHHGLRLRPRPRRSVSRGGDRDSRGALERDCTHHPRRHAHRARLGDERQDAPSALGDVGGRHADIGDVGRGPRDQPRIFLALDLGADEPWSRHAGSSREEWMPGHIH